MEVLFDPLEIINSFSTNRDDETVATTPQSDLFLQLIANLNPQLLTPIVQADTNKEPVPKEEDNSEIEFVNAEKNDELNEIFAQISLINLLNPIQTDEKREPNPEFDASTPSVKSPCAQRILPASLTNFIKKETEADEIKPEKIIETTNTLEELKYIPQTTGKLDLSLEMQEKNDLNTDLKLTQMTAQKIVQKADQKIDERLDQEIDQKIDQRPDQKLNLKKDETIQELELISQLKTSSIPIASPEIKKPVVFEKFISAENTPLETKLNILNQQSIPDDKAELSNIQQIQVTPSLNRQDSKEVQYFNALTQLGHFINHQTTQYALNNNVAPASELSKIDYGTLLKSPPPVDHEFKIELSSSLQDISKQANYTANIKIYPPKLGEVLAKLKIDKDSISLVILLENRVVHELVQSSLDQLKATFQQANINLSHIELQTSEMGTQYQEGKGQSSPERFVQNEESSEIMGETGESSKTSTNELNSIIDTYA